MLHNCALEQHGIRETVTESFRVACPRDDERAEIENATRRALIDLHAFDLTHTEFNDSSTDFY